MIPKTYISCGNDIVDVLLSGTTLQTSPETFLFGKYDKYFFPISSVLFFINFWTQGYLNGKVLEATLLIILSQAVFLVFFCYQKFTLFFTEIGIPYEKSNIFFYMNNKKYFLKMVEIGAKNLIREDPRSLDRLDIYIQTVEETIIECKSKMIPIAPRLQILGYFVPIGLFAITLLIDSGHGLAESTALVSLVFILTYVTTGILIELYNWNLNLQHGKLKTSLKIMRGIQLNLSFI